MSDDSFAILVVLGLIILACMIFGGRHCRKTKLPNTRRNLVLLESNQQEDIYNISSRVQGQGQWPTHDNHVSLDHFTIANEINKYNDDPPTYEEAISIAASNNNNSVVPAVVPKSTTPPPPPFPTDDESTTVSASASTRN